MIRLKIKIMLFMLIMLFMGFVYFLYIIPNKEEHYKISTDAIIVLTGSAGRINYGLSMFCLNPDKKILISGVKNKNFLASIKKLCGYDNAKNIKKNIFLDHQADSTITNAIETKKWVDKHNIKSITVITSDFHIPRAESEFNNIVKDVDIIFMPYQSKKIDVEKWWELNTLRILLIEYYKYLLHVVNRLNYIYG
jgi:uncharacterized SAM-binding protein YcdF (DUF218 family)